MHMLLTFALSFMALAEISIIGGKPARSIEAPWVVKIEKDKDHWCSGSLIAPRWIVTAAHCFDEGEVPGDFYVYAGGTGLKKDLVELAPVRQIIRHPKFGTLSFTPQYDIALLELHENVPTNAGIRPIGPATMAELNSLRDETPVSIFGWGFVDKNAKQPTSLMRLDIPLVKTADVPKLKTLKFFQTYPLWVSPNFVVTVANKLTTCNGDSGTGWTMNVKGTPKIIAVHSAGDRCDSISIGNPIGPHIQWISESMR